MVGKTAALGAALAMAIGVIAGLAWSPRAGVVAGGFGVLATLVQVAAVALVAPVLKGPWQLLMRRWMAGMAMRIVGVVAFGAAVVIDRELFPPVVAALGLLGVMIPLLFYEARLLR